MLPPNPAQSDFRPYVINYLHNNLTFTDPIRNRFKAFFESSHNKTYVCSVNPSIPPLQNQLHFGPSKIIEEESRCKVIVTTKPNGSFTFNNSMKFLTIILSLVSTVLIIRF